MSEAKLHQTAATLQPDHVSSWIKYDPEYSDRRLWWECLNACKGKRDVAWSAHQMYVKRGGPIVKVTPGRLKKAGRFESIDRRSRDEKRQDAAREHIARWLNASIAKARGQA